VHQLSLADVNRVITDQALDKQTQELLSASGLVLDFVS
ncbi:DeoR family transcriptional regulator, partial [Streptococcus pyogenes]